MDYSIGQLADLAGISQKALRHFERLGLLRPARRPGNGYRVYGEAEVNRLQQVLLYRELGLPLAAVKALLDAPGFDPGAALKGHLKELKERQRRLGVLIGTVEASLRALEREEDVDDRKKFEGFKQELVAENERRYGAEIREKYGDEAVDGSNEKLMGMRPKDYEAAQALSRRVNELLAEAVKAGDPRGAAAAALCEAHRRWLKCYWKTYTQQAHLGLAELYVADERFKAYYDAVAPGGAAFLRDALRAFCAE